MSGSADNTTRQTAFLQHPVRPWPQLPGFELTTAASVLGDLVQTGGTCLHYIKGIS